MVMGHPQMNIRRRLACQASAVALTASLVTTFVPIVPAQALDYTISTAEVAPYTILPNDNLTITSTGSAPQVQATSVISSNLLNDGTIVNTSGVGFVLNSGTMGTISNNGLIQGSSNGAELKSGSVSSLVNAGTIKALGNAGLDLASGTSIDNLENLSTGLITGDSSGLQMNNATIGTLTNAGTISGSKYYGVFGYGTISKLDNSGLISGQTGIYTNGTIGALVNSGTITGSKYGIYKSGNGSTISAFDNSGLISGANAAIRVDSGAIGTIANTGTVQGDIYIVTGENIVFTGGSGGTIGTLTGYNSGATGNINAGNVAFLSGAILLNDNVTASSGSGSVINSAELHVNSGVNITGNYIQKSAGSLVIGVSSASDYGKLVISGTAALNGTVTIVEISTGAISVGDSYTIVDATGSISGSFSSVSITGNSFTTIVSGTQYTVSITSGSSGSTPIWETAGNQAGQGSLGQALDTLSTQSEYGNLLTRIRVLSSEGQSHALQQLAPNITAAKMSNTLALSGPVTKAVEARQVAQHDFGASKGVAAGSPVATNGLWGQVLGAHSRLDGSATEGGYAANYGGFLIGVDHKPTANTSAGVAISWLNGKSKGSDASSGQSTDLNSYALTFYGKWRPDGQALHFDGELGAAYDSFDQSRKIDVSGDVASADYNGQHYNARIGVGYDIPLSEGTTLTPLSALRYAYVRSESYDETGAGVANLHVNSNNFDSLEGEIGARISHDVTTGLGAMTLDAKAALVHDFTNSPVSVAASLGGVGFVSRSDKPAENGVRLGLGSTLFADDGLSLRLQYDGDLRSDYVSHNGMFMLRQEF